MNLANLLSMSRILLVPCFFLLFYYSSKGDRQSADIWLLEWGARLILLIIILSDFFDGFVARRRRHVTTLGSLLDPLADKLFVITSFLLLTAFQRLPAWLTIIVVSKDIFVLVGWTLVATILGRLESMPTETGKWATAFQFVTIAAAVFSVTSLWPYLAQAIYWSTAGLTVVSVGQYALKGLRLLAAGNTQPGR